MEYIIKKLLENRLRLNEEYSWIGGAPWGDDLFYENANNLGLTVEQEMIDVNGTPLEFDYVVLNRLVCFYHATTSSKVESILSQGLKTQTQAGGKYVSGVFLSGYSDTLHRWRGNDTVVLEVILRSGTKVYQDRQPNAVFIRENVPSEYIRVYTD